ncbi:MAG TPA: hypothetical protein VG965_07345 [Patescibacteria group bacterium]|nr:hypothetical protein [Patescibacteria group bacterium]
MADIKNPENVALGMGPEKSTLPTGIDPKFDEAHRMANELIDVRNGQKSVAERISHNASYRDFDDRSEEAFLVGFTGGEGRLDKTTGKVDLTGVGALGRENYNHARDIYKKNEQALTYTQIRKEAARDGKPIDEARRQHGIRSADFIKLRENALDTLCAEGGLNTIFPELKTIGATERRDYIDQVLASDPRLNELILDNMEAFQKRISELKPLAKTEERRLAEEAQTKAEKGVNDTLDNLVRSAGIPITEIAAVKNRVKTELESGATSSRMQDQLYQERLKLIGITSPQNYADYQTARVAFDTANTVKGNIEAEIAKLESDAGTATNPALKDSIRNKIALRRADATAALNSLATATANLNDVKSKIGLNDDNLIKDRARQVDEIKYAIYGEKQPDGNYRGGVAEIGGRLVDRQLDLHNARIELKKTDTAETDAERATRLREERAIAEDMKGLLSTSINELLSERAGKLDGLHKAKLEKMQEEARKKGDKESEAWAKKYKDELDKLNPFNDKKKKREPNRNEIRLHADSLIQKGEDGAMERVAGMAGYDLLGLEEGPARDKVAGQLFAGVDYASLNDDQKQEVDDNIKIKKEKFDAFYKKVGDDYKDTVLKDLFLARGLRDKTILGRTTGELSFSNDEWRMLHEKFGDRFDKALAASGENKQIDEKLKAAGITDALSMFKWKYLWWALGAAAAASVVGGSIATGGAFAPVAGLAFSGAKTGANFLFGGGGSADYATSAAA